MIGLLLALPLTLALHGREQEAFDYLQTATTFEMPHIGIAGARSRGYLALRILQRSARAADAFKELACCASTAGQLYGLCGLYDADPTAFSAALERHRSMAGNVKYFSGCIVFDRPAAEIVCSKKSLRVPRGADYDLFLQSVPPSKQAYEEDICGGALPAIFRQRDHDEAGARDDERLADFHRRDP